MSSLCVALPAGSGADGGSGGKLAPRACARASVPPARVATRMPSQRSTPRSTTTTTARPSSRSPSFAHLLLRVSQARLPLKRRSKDVAAQFIAMVEEFVLPNAKRDELAFLRDALTTDRQLRHVTYMYRHKLGAIFRKHCGPQRGDRSDKTRRDPCRYEASPSC